MSWANQQLITTRYYCKAMTVRGSREQPFLMMTIQVIIHLFSFHPFQFFPTPPFSVFRGSYAVASAIDKQFCFSPLGPVLLIWIIIIIVTLQTIFSVTRTTTIHSVYCKVHSWAPQSTFEWQFLSTGPAITSLYQRRGCRSTPENLWHWCFGRVLL